MILTGFDIDSREYQAISGNVIYDASCENTLESKSFTFISLYDKDGNIIRNV